MAVERATARVSNIPLTATAGDLLAFLDTKLGPNTVLAIDILTERKNWKSRGHGRVQFQTLEAKLAARRLSVRKELVFRGLNLALAETYEDIVARPLEERQRLDDGVLHLGFMAKEDVMCGLECWDGVRAWVMPERKRVEFWVAVGEEWFKVEIPFEHVREAVVCKVGDGMEIQNAILLKVTFAPKLYQKDKGPDVTSKSAANRYFICKEDCEVKWIRTTDFSEVKSVGQSTSFCWMMKEGSVDFGVFSCLPCFKERSECLNLEDWRDFHPSSDLVPLVNCDLELKQPYEVLFQINSLVHAQKNIEAAVSVENSDSKGKSLSFADHVKDNVKSGRNHLGVTNDDVQSNRVSKNIGTAAEKDSNSENKVKKTKKKKDNVKTSKGDQTNGDQRKQPSENISTASEKDMERDKKLKKRKKKINSADNHLGGCSGEDDRVGKEKLDETVNGVEDSKKSKKRKKTAEAIDSSENSKSKGRRVSFSDDVEVFPLPEYLKYRKLNSEGDTIQGKRYTQEEDALILQAVDDYILEHGMAGDGVDRDLDEGWKRARSLIMNCKKNPELKGCWKEISRAIPRRTIRSTYERAHILYERAESRKWSKEELGTIRKFCEEHGPKWRLLGDILGKSRKHVKDAYRRVKMANIKKGAWSQEEYEQLFKLVNNDIIMRAAEEKKVKHGMLRDNIAWGAISDKLQTRASPSCCDRWYYQICSSMVLEGKWASTDDYRLVEALYTQDACCMEDVEWDALLEHRSRDLCHQRWKEMVRNLGEYRSKPFLEHVQILHERFDPDLIEPIEIYKSKVPIDV